jgi:hypothetical protein
MNPKIQKTVREIERARAKLAELQALLPELEKQKTELENLEIVRLVRSARIAPSDLPEFLRREVAVKQFAAPVRAETRTELTETEGIPDEN